MKICRAPRSSCKAGHVVRGLSFSWTRAARACTSSQYWISRFNYFLALATARQRSLCKNEKFSLLVRPFQSSNTEDIHYRLVRKWILFPSALVSRCQSLFIAKFPLSQKKCDEVLLILQKTCIVWLLITSPQSTQSTHVVRTGPVYSSVGLLVCRLVGQSVSRTNRLVGRFFSNTRGTPRHFRPWEAGE